MTDLVVAYLSCQHLLGFSVPRLISVSLFRDLGFICFVIAWVKDNVVTGTINYNLSRVSISVKKACLLDLRQVVNDLTARTKSTFN